MTDIIVYPDNSFCINGELYSNIHFDMLKSYKIPFSRIWEVEVKYEKIKDAKICMFYTNPFEKTWSKKRNKLVSMKFYSRRAKTKCDISCVST